MGEVPNLIAPVNLDVHFVGVAETLGKLEGILFMGCSPPDLLPVIRQGSLIPELSEYQKHHSPFK
jgi:hypothetical protein